MAKDPRDDPWQKVRKRNAPPMKIIDGIKYRKRKIKQVEREEIEEGLEEYYNGK